MKYSDKYPSFKNLEEVEPGLFLTATNKTCCMCGQATPWLDTQLRDFVCSEECSKAVKEEIPKQYTKK